MEHEANGINALFPNKNLIYLFFTNPQTISPARGGMSITK